VLAIGATRAIFSDTEAIEGNTVSTATIDIDLRALSSGIIPKPLNVNGLLPGNYTDWARAEIFNTSESSEARLYAYIDDLEGSACPDINLIMTTGNAGSNEMEFSVYDGPLTSLVGPGNRQEITGYVFPTLMPNITSVIQQRAQLDPEADNEAQGESCTWTEYFVAETVEEEEL
jgi:hypothetical protein